MHSRRKFLIQGSLATTAMLALKPLSSIANAVSPFTGISGNNKLVFLHTTNPVPAGDNNMTRYIKEIKNKRPNTILLKAGKDVKQETGQISYDVSVPGSNTLSAITGDYKIINKGSLRTGIISVHPGESDIIQKVNSLSAFLKKEKNCAVVVCLSGLGYKNKNAPDDITLAKRSTHLDMIIGGHPANFHAHPVIVLNNDQTEVIIHSAPGDPLACGFIEIGFDGQSRKNSISFTHHVSNNTAPGRAMPQA